MGIHTDKRECENMTKKSHRRALTIELNQKTYEYDGNNNNKINLLRRQTWTTNLEVGSLSGFIEKF